MYSSVHCSSVTTQHSASSTLLFNLVMINWFFIFKFFKFFNFSPQRQAPRQCHDHFQMMEWNVSHIFPLAAAQQCSAQLFQPFMKTRFFPLLSIKSTQTVVPVVSAWTWEFLPRPFRTFYWSEVHVERNIIHLDVDTLCLSNKGVALFSVKV